MRVIRLLCGPFFVFAGAMHFIQPRFYLRMMPPWLPRHRELVNVSGVAEIAGGLALMSPSRRLRRLGGWWTILTLLAVFPANVHMAANAEKFTDVPAPALWARLPFQAVFIGWVLSAMRRGSAAAPVEPLSR